MNWLLFYGKATDWQLSTGKWSRGQISWDRNSLFHEVEFMRSNFLSCFMRSKFLIIDLIPWSRHFSWDQNYLIMLFRVSISWLHLQLTNLSWDQNFLIMLYFEFRSHDRFVSHKNDHEIEIRNNAFLGFNLMIEVSTSWSILLDKFDLMNKHNFDHMIKNLISWKSWISISWNLTFWPWVFQPTFRIKILLIWRRCFYCDRG